MLSETALSISLHSRDNPSFYGFPFIRNLNEESVHLHLVTGGERTYAATRVVTPSEANAHERMQRSGLALYQEALKNFFGADQLKKLEGRNVVVPYLDTGYGHRNQAWDLSLALSSILKVNAIFTSPLDNIHEADAMFFKVKLVIHSAIQHNHNNFIQAAEELIKSKVKRTSFGKEIKDQVTIKCGKLLLTFAQTQIESMITAAEQANKIIPIKMTRMKKAIDALVKRCEYDPKVANVILRSFGFLDASLSERALASHTLEMARHTDAIGIVTTHSACVRATDTVMKRRRLGTKNDFPIITAIPDNGYVPQEVPFHDQIRKNSKDPNGGELGEGMLLQPLAGGWNRDLIHTVADKNVKGKLAKRFRIKPEKIFETGTISDAITPEQFIEKWKTDERRILMSVNGNASNVEKITQFLHDLGSENRQDWKEKKYIIKIFLADHEEKRQEVQDVVESCGLQNFVEIIVTPHTRKSETAEVRQKLQRWAHVEWRTPGENILTGANVGCCEVGLDAGTALNEPHNMLYMGRKGAALYSSYPPETHAYWKKDLEKRGLKPELYESYGFSDKPIETAVRFLDTLFEAQDDGSSLAYRTARQGYGQAMMDANFRIAALLVFEHLKPVGKTYTDLIRMFDEVTQKHRAHIQRVLNEKDPVLLAIAPVFSS